MLAPCILPLLPVIVGGSIARGEQDGKAARSWRRPLIIAASLGISVIFFTLILKATTALLGIPQSVWQIISGIIVTLLGVNFLWPELWAKLAEFTKFHSTSNKFLGKSFGKTGFGGDAVTGFALGPVFNSCSPTYALIIATVLPVSFSEGFIYLAAYAIGLSGMLLIIAYAGQSLAVRLGWLANPGGWFRRIVGILFIAVGLSVSFGLDRKLQAFVLERGWYDPISRIEQSLR